MTSYLKSNQIYKSSISEKNLTESRDENELRNLQSEKTEQYQELYNKRKETLDKINKSTLENEKDFYRKNVEWKKKM